MIWELKHPNEPKTSLETWEDYINSYFPVDSKTNLSDLKRTIDCYQQYLSLNKPNLLNLSKKKVLDYYSDVLNCINLTEVCRMQLDGARELIKFLDLKYLHLEEYKQGVEEYEQGEKMKNKIKEV